MSVISSIDPAGPSGYSMFNNITSFVRESRMLPVIVVLALIWAYFAWASPLFLSPRNLSNLSLQTVVTAIVALAIAITLIAGEIDFSVVANGAVSATVSSTLAVVYQVDPSVSVLCGLLTGGLIGFLQGAVVTFLQAPSFIVTLGGSIVLQGVLLILLPSGQTLISLMGNPLGTIATTYLPWEIGAAFTALIAAWVLLLKFTTWRSRRQFGDARTFFGSVGFPVLIVILAGAVVTGIFQLYRGVPLIVAGLLLLTSVLTYLLRQTRFGLHLYAIGNNAEAARRSGISVKSMKLAAFTVGGMLAAFGGIVAAMRVLGVSTDSGNSSLMMEAVAAAVIGGVSLFGGRGSAWAPLIGALIMGSITNGLILIDASTPVRMIIQGGILTLAVVLDAYLARRTRSAR
ncbi:inner-membrane translocator [Agrobacterium rhizogenes]|nr:inner-membrane translocator [Rhizobium rhizogenes]